jgi:hypothetical protein
MVGYHPYYLFEAVLFSVVGWALLIAYGLQLIAEKPHSGKMGRVHRTFHVCGFLMGFTLVFTGVDPQGVLGLIRWDVLLLVKDLFSCIAYMSLSVWTSTLIIIVGEHWGSSGALKLSRLLEKDYVKYCTIATVVNMIVFAVSDGLAIQANNTFPRAICLLYLSLSFLTASILLMYTTYQFFKSNKQVKNARLSESPQPSQMERRGCCSEYGFFNRETRKLRHTAWVFLFCALMQFQASMSIASNPVKLSTEQVPPDPENVHVFFWILPFWLGMGIGLYGSWLPLDFLCCANKSKDQTTDKHSSNIKNSAVAPAQHSVHLSVKPVASEIETAGP